MTISLDFDSMEILFCTTYKGSVSKLSQRAIGLVWSCSADLLTIPDWVEIYNGIIKNYKNTSCV